MHQFGRTAGVAVLDSPSSTAPSPGEGVRLQTYLALVGQLLLLVLLVQRFQIETEAFLRLSILTVVGFAVHYFVPFRYRLWVFVAISLAGLALVLGVTAAAWVVALGLMLIGVAHLPIHIYARAALLLALGLGLAVPRWGLGHVPWSSAVWPVLGSMFVFRMMSYVYDRQYQKERPRLSQALAYFFLLPNVCFPLFPVVDFKRFCRSYYDTERHDIYQVGVEWIWRGLVQLLFYRLVYFRLTIDPVAVDNAGDLAVYILSTFLLYVRLSGYFHLVIGMVRLFGFNLPETHHRYFLASSFTDFWRRINIYWKDFMMKMVYYPIFFRARRLGDTQALVIATVLTFVATWFFHLTQWFWIRGSVLTEVNDAVFWGLFGLLVLINALYEARRGRVRSLVKRERNLRDSLVLVAKTAGTFTAISVMWSFWTAESATDWLLMVRSAFVLPPWTAPQWLLLATATIAAVGIAVYGVWKGWDSGQWSLAPQRSVATIMVTTVGLCALTIPAVSHGLGRAGEVVDSVALTSASGLNRRDAENFQRGYYENLLDISKFDDELRRRYEQMPADFVRSLTRLGLTRQTGDAQDYELLPGKSGRFVGAMVQTNRWGMRDKDYSLARPADTYRMALLGPSTAMGSGVEDKDTFEAVLEDRLNREAAAGRHYEILNFGVAGYAPLHVVYQLDRKVFAFQPQAILYLGHASDIDRTSTQYVRMIRKRIMPDDPYLRDLERRTGITPTTGPNEARRRMKPYTTELTQWVYRRIADDARRHGVEPVFVYLETVTDPMEEWRAGQRLEVLDLARKAGFAIVDLTGVWNGYTPPQLWIWQNDGHPNVLGNRLIANRLHDLLLHRQDLQLASAR